MKTKGHSTGLVPPLRFPEFREAERWELTPLKKIALPVTDRATTGDGDNVLSLSGELGLVLQSDFFGKKVAGDSAERYLKLERDDFVYNDRTTKASAYGTIKRLSKYDGGIVSPIYKCFRFKPSENPAFWDFYFESGNHDQQLRTLINEGARAGRFNISISQFLSTSALRPDEPEQQKIAECLGSLDDVIAAQGDRVAALRAHKTGLMQQLFPRPERIENGIKIPAETTPRLRFPEFQDAGEWEETTLGEVATFASGGTPSKDNPSYWNGHIPWVSASSMYDTLVERADHYVTQLAIGNGTRIAKKGSILILVRGSMLFKRVPICLAGIDVAFNQDVKALELRKSNIGQFILYQLIAFQSRFSIDETGIGAGKIELEELKNFKIFIPVEIAEQQRIADCLTSLDTLIAAEVEKLGLLKTHKKGLMQQLFPVVEAAA